MKYTPDFSSRFRILKGGKVSLVVSALLAGTTMTFAAPSGGQVTTGSASISQSGSVTTINQSTNKASINWNSFSIAPTETVNFVQPSSQSVTLNRVIGTSRSLIEGAMNANGQVFLLNPNGVLFANGSAINVGGLVASTLNISDANFQAGNYVFEGNSQNSIINMGTITANNGYVAMMGKHVANEGTIVATMGNVQMASGEKISLNLNGNSLVKLTIDQGTMDALVENKGLIKADGGQVYLTTQALNTILDGMVNNTGVIEAQTLNDVTGEVILFAHGGTANIAGTIDATGGFIETSGQAFSVADGTVIKAKEWLIDPADITIESTGSTSDLTASSIKASFIESTLNGGAGVTLSATNDIFVNEALSWNQSLLTLTAGNTINVNAAMTATGTAGVALNYGAGGLNMAMNATKDAFTGKINIASTGSVTINTNPYTIISDRAGLAAMASGLSGRYVLGTGIDLSTGGDWTPIGQALSWSSQTPFNGTLNGLGHTVSNMTVAQETTGMMRGLFGKVDSGAIENIGLVNANVAGYDYVGGLVGFVEGAVKIRNAFSSGTVSSLGSNVGGLVGAFTQTGASAYNVYSKGTVASAGGASIGGLIGSFGTNAVLSNSGSEASVTGGSNIGGLVGTVQLNGLVENSYAKGNVETTLPFAGGLVGALGVNEPWTSKSSIQNSYATGNVTSRDYIGGLVGIMAGGTKIKNSYSSGTVYVVGESSTGYFGGLVGSINASTIENSYTTGTIVNSQNQNTSLMGGLIGGKAGVLANTIITNSFFDKTLNPNMTDEGTYGKSTADLKISTTFIGWDIAEDSSLSNVYPQLRWKTTGIGAGTSVWVIGSLGTPVAYNFSTLTGSYVYNGNPYSLTDLWSASSLFGNTYSSWELETDYKFKYNDNYVTDFTNAGNYSNITVDILKSGFVTASNGNTAGTLTIDKRPVNVTVAKDYDTNANFTTGFTLGNIVDGETVMISSGTASVSSANPNVYNSFASNALVLSDATNYTFTGGTVSATINKLQATYTLPTTTIANNAHITAGTTITLPTPELTSGTTPVNAPTVKVYDSQNNDVTASALAGTLAVGSYTIKTALSDTVYDVSNSSDTIAFSVIAASTPEETQQQVNNIVTTIVNSTTVTPTAPIVLAPLAPQPQQVQTQAQNNILLQSILPQGMTDSGGSFGLVGSTGGTTPVQTVSMDQLQSAALTQGVGEIRVPLGNGSMVELINGGVTLPTGVSQEFYIVASNTQTGTTMSGEASSPMSDGTSTGRKKK